MRKTTSSQQGVALIEALIAMLIVAFGMLGYIGLQTRTTVANLEGYQRSQALILVNDMAERIKLNRANAAAYVGNGIGVTIVNPDDCTGSALSTAQRDLCEWSLLIQGAAEVKGDSRVGAVIGARGCVTNPSANQYLIALAWQGIQASGAPVNTCGQGTFGSDDLRRVVSVVVQIGSLLATTPPGSTP